jgi:hypothetical protein
MNGFKDGASTDSPFGDTEEEEKDTEDATSQPSPDTDYSSADRDAQETPGEREISESEQSAETTAASDSSGSLPWIYQRTSIMDGREKTVQLHLRSSTLDKQRQGLAEVEGLLGESVKKADLREAAFLVGLTHLDEVRDKLRDWGYDFE